MGGSTSATNSSPSSSRFGDRQLSSMEQHFLVLTYPLQGHINPALHLARRLARVAGARITFSTALSGHRRMFPSSADGEVDDGLISYVPHSDGYDDGYKPDVDDIKDQWLRTRSIGSKTLSAVIRSLDERGRPVTCVIYTLLLPWAADVAHEHGLPSVLYCIQPATVFALYYHYFHGYDGLIASHRQDPLFQMNLPGLSPFRICDLPSFLRITSPDDPYFMLIEMFQETFDVLDGEEARSTARVLVNTFEELESVALVASGKMKLIPIGPTVPSALLEGTEGARGTGSTGVDLFKLDEKQYMEWLDSKPEKSVVYVSFGSLAVIKKRQAEEIVRGLKESGRPYLWVLKKENRRELEGEVEVEEGGGMVVEWCSQVRVLSHPAVGCFVTHCGWNSTVESMACGVPMVAVPQWSDQSTNARLMELWGTGVRGELDGEGVLEGAELSRCVEIVMGEGETGKEMRRRAEMWKEKAREAVSEGGSSDRNLRAFVEEIASLK
ncbi:UDP-glucoronosyl and UDP-glucosyl transferase [Musa troglodytarum]|uniref:Glycosyltransferase n=1 Tax=Musa troglodytarum TaxID=320322 RepID=A0A9E7G7L9_9LILI|nr:UDP-glucoronosyl and UDP-glucosyl transferase [Musa troglodytarum]